MPLQGGEGEGGAAGWTSNPAVVGLLQRARQLLDGGGLSERELEERLLGCLKVSRAAGGMGR